MKAKFNLSPTLIRGTDNEYRKIRAWNNSSLGDLYYRARGMELPPKPERAFHFGSAIHLMLLEPEWWVAEDWGLTGKELQDAEGMAEAVARDMELAGIIKAAQREIICTWRDRATGLRCKSKIDALPDGDMMIDLKTTRHRTRLDFLDSCKQYEYDRQAAFYADGARRKRFLIVGLQKVAPYNIYYFETGEGKEFFETGRKKYRKLLSIAAEQGLRTPRALERLNPK